MAAARNALVARQPDVEPVLLQVALDVVYGEALDHHQLQHTLWCGPVGPAQLVDSGAEPRMQLRRPS